MKMEVTVLYKILKTTHLVIFLQSRIDKDKRLHLAAQFLKSNDLLRIMITQQIFI